MKKFRFSTVCVKVVSVAHDENKLKSYGACVIVTNDLKDTLSKIFVTLTVFFHNTLVPSKLYEIVSKTDAL